MVAVASPPASLMTSCVELTLRIRLSRSSIARVMVTGCAGPLDSSEQCQGGGLAFPERELGLEDLNSLSLH